MKKGFILLIIITLILGNFNISHANMLYGVRTLVLDDLTGTNLDSDEDTIYVLITGITVDNSSDDSNSGWSTIEFVIDLGIDLNNYEVKEIYPYDPSTFSFKTPNLYRTITNHSETQREFNEFYYQSIYSDPDWLWGFQGEVKETYLHGFFEAGFKPEYARYNLDNMLKIPGGEKQVLEAFPIKDNNSRDYFKNLIGKNVSGTREEFTSRLYTQSVIFQLEKISSELPVQEDPMGYAGVWKSSADINNYFTLIIESSDKYKDKYLVALNSQAGIEVGITSIGYIEFKEDKQYLSRQHDWEYYEGEPYPTFYIELQDGKAVISTDNPFSKMFGNKVTFDLQNKDPGVWGGLEESDGEYIQYFK